MWICYAQQCAPPRSLAQLLTLSHGSAIATCPVSSNVHLQWKELLVRRETNLSVYCKKPNLPPSGGMASFSCKEMEAIFCRCPLQILRDRSHTTSALTREGATAKENVLNFLLCIIIFKYSNCVRMFYVNGSIQNSEAAGGVRGQLTDGTWETKLVQRQRLTKRGRIW